MVTASLFEIRRALVRWTCLTCGSSSHPMSRQIHKSLKRNSIVLALWSGPVCVYLLLLLDFLFVRPGDPLPSIDAVEFVVLVVVFVLSISMGVTAALIALIWAYENPSARLHESLGFSRFASLAATSGPIWLLYMHLTTRRFHSDELIWLIIFSLFISFGSWLLVNVIGWAASGFSKRDG